MTSLEYNISASGLRQTTKGEGTSSTAGKLAIFFFSLWWLVNRRLRHNFAEDCNREQERTECEGQYLRPLVNNFTSEVSKARLPITIRGADSLTGVTAFGLKSSPSEKEVLHHFDGAAVPSVACH